MRENEALPAWARRQWNRRLGRQGSEMVVRWIALRPMKDAGDGIGSDGSRPCGGEDVVVFANAREVQDA